MPERVILHVGPHKTGTTALQKAFAVNAKRLAAYGILYPDTGRDGAAHQNVARACWKADNPLLGELAEEIADCRVAFLSSELISALDLKGLQRLAPVFADVPIEVVYVLRRLPLLLPSHWRELVKHGQSLDFGEYLEYARGEAPWRYLAPPMPVAQLERLSEVFGSESLRLAVYDQRACQIEGYGPGFIDDVFGLGHEAAHFETERYNITAPDWQVELGRHLNIMAGDKLNYPQKFALRNAMVSRVSEDAPDWLDEFQSRYEGAEPERLSDQTPFVRGEVEEVLRLYEAYFVDPVEDFTAPLESEVRVIATDQLPAAVGKGIHDLFSDLVAQLPADLKP